MPLFSHSNCLSILAQSFDKPQIKRTDFTYCVLAFALLEAAFLTLAWFCLLKPIPINPPSYISISVTKAIITGIAVVWHAFATLMTKDVISCVFSAECMAQYYQTNCLEPGATDCVSCITTGLLSHTSFFLTKQPTTSYRLAYILVLLSMILGPLGASVIILGDSVMTSQQQMPIANLTMTVLLASFAQRFCSRRADRISWIEFLEGITFGYGTDNDRMLIPWPQPGSETI